MILLPVRSSSSLRHRRGSSSHDILCNLLLLSHCCMLASSFLKMTHAWPGATMTKPYHSSSRRFAQSSVQRKLRATRWHIHRFCQSQNIIGYADHPRRLLSYKCHARYSPYDTSGPSVVPHIFRVSAARRFMSADATASAAASLAEDPLETQPPPPVVAGPMVTPPKPRAASRYYGPRSTTHSAAASSVPRKLFPSTKTQPASIRASTTVHNNKEEEEEEYIVLSRTPINATALSEEPPPLLNPYDLLPTDPVTGKPYLAAPKALSPSSIKEFQNCPQSFLFQYILGLKSPTKPALAKGSMCHAALERLFDLEPSERSLPVLQNLFRTAWAEHRHSDTYRSLFEDDVRLEEEDENGTTTTIQERRRSISRERRWGQEGLALLQQYWAAEDAAQIGRPNPVQREVWVAAPLAVAGPRRPTTTTNTTTTRDDADPDNNNIPDDNNQEPRFLVRGIVDRLDMVQDTQDKSQVTLRLIDYKTGAAPELKYSPAMNEKIQKEALDQLLIYALLLRDQHAKKEQKLPLRYLRLFYLTSAQATAVYWDLDLGATEEERRVLLDAVHAAVAQVYRDIVALLQEQDPRVFVGCQRSFCYCHQCRPKFQPGTVWEPAE